MYADFGDIFTSLLLIIKGNVLNMAGNLHWAAKLWKDRATPVFAAFVCPTRRIRDFHTTEPPDFSQHFVSW